MFVECRAIPIIHIPLSSSQAESKVELFLFSSSFFSIFVCLFKFTNLFKSFAFFPSLLPLFQDLFKIAIMQFRSFASVLLLLPVVVATPTSFHQLRSSIRLNAMMEWATAMVVSTAAYTRTIRAPMSHPIMFRIRTGSPSSANAGRIITWSINLSDEFFTIFPRGLVKRGLKPANWIAWREEKKDKTHQREKRS